MVDVVVVFYSAANVGSEMFKLAFRTVVNEVLPRLGRPYTVYRFSLDAEPDFVPEMVASLGLPPDNPVTVAGYAWSGPGRRLFMLGDRALESPAVFQRSLRLSLQGKPAQLEEERPARRQVVRSLERSRERAVRPWGGRALAVLLWCVFGTAALGAAAVGIAPNWTSSLLHPTSVRGPGSAADGSSLAGKSPPETTRTDALPPAAVPDATASTPLAEGVEGQTKPVKPGKHTKRKRTSSWLSVNPPYWGLPPDRSR